MRTSTSRWWSGATTTGGFGTLRPTSGSWAAFDRCGGATLFPEAGYRPHVIVGDMDSASDTGPLCGAELVVHAYLTAAARA
jgi:hypothetical protein